MMLHVDMKFLFNLNMFTSGGRIFSARSRIATPSRLGKNPFWGKFLNRKMISCKSGASYAIVQTVFTACVPDVAMQLYNLYSQPVSRMRYSLYCCQQHFLPNPLTALTRPWVDKQYNHPCHSSPACASQEKHAWFIITSLKQLAILEEQSTWINRCTCPSLLHSQQNKIKGDSKHIIEWQALGDQ